MNFTPQQQHSLLSKMGYNGPVDSNMMDAFLSSNPGAAAKMGKFDRVMKKGFALGGFVPEVPTTRNNTSGFAPGVTPPETTTGKLPLPVTPLPETPPGTTLPRTFPPETPQDFTSGLNTIYQDELGRDAGSAGLGFYLPYLESGQMNLDQVRQDVQGNKATENLVNQLYQENAGRAGDPAGLNFYIQKLKSGEMTEDQIASQIRAAASGERDVVAGEAVGPTDQSGIQSALERVQTTGRAGVDYWTEQLRLSQQAVDQEAVSTAQEQLRVARESGDEEAISAAEEALKVARNDDAQQAAMAGLQRAQQDLNSDLARLRNSLPTTSEMAATALTDPMSMVTQATPPKMTVGEGQLVDPSAGVPTAPVGQAGTTTVGTTSQAATPEALTAAQMTAQTVSPAVRREMDNLQAAQGVVSDKAQVTAAQGELSEGAFASGVSFDEGRIEKVQAGELGVTSEQLATAQGLDKIAPAAKIAESAGIDPVVAEQGTVSENELPQPAQIKESEMAQAAFVTSGGKLSEDATAVAAKLDSFTVDNGTLAAAVQGDVNAQDTVQGQLASLMRQFDDGTPAWAAGAMRAANAVMAARGLGGSSMAGAAIVQAAMESAIPIAAQDAQTFAQMNMSNLDRRQQVALTNAAAQQGLALQNLNNEQQAALQNSTNAFQLQVQDLSNMQQTIIANAQLKASLQGQNLSNQQQTNLAVAARYAEVANMNLNNRQQTALVKNSNNLTIEMSNLSNKQQSYIANAQLEASLQNKQIDNQQQVAIQNAARFSEAANITFTAEQQAALHNSELMKTIGLAELNSEQAATLQNAANIANMDMANLNNRQQAAVQNAKAFLEMDMANLNNRQQTAIFKSQQIVNSMLSDQAAENAAAQFNAASENQTNQFFADLQSTVSRFNADQVNGIAKFNAGEENATARFNESLAEQRQQFEASNRLIVAQANAKWRQDIATVNTAMENEALMESVKAANGMTTTAIDNAWQRERDLMDFAYRSSESEKDRNVSILLADKNLEAAREKLDAQADMAKGAATMDFILDAAKELNFFG